MLAAVPAVLDLIKVLGDEFMMVFVLNLGVRIAWLEIEKTGS